jgi:hypothetical protein
LDFSFSFSLSFLELFAFSFSFNFSFSFSLSLPLASLSFFVRDSSLAAFLSLSFLPSDLSFEVEVTFSVSFFLDDDDFLSLSFDELAVVLSFLSLLSFLSDLAPSFFVVLSFVLSSFVADFLVSDLDADLDFFAFLSLSSLSTSSSPEASSIYHIISRQVPKQ